MDSTDADKATFQITLIDPSGDTVFSRVFAYAPRAVSDDAINRVAEALHDALGRGPGPHAIARVLRDDNLVPPALPPASALTLGQDGSIWLRREDVPGDSALWNVLDAKGEVRGVVRLPRRDSVIAARGDLIAAVEHDELDVPYVVEYRLDH